jgi:ribosomal protein S18 acetylase RimI-like enzyme
VSAVAPGPRGAADERQYCRRVGSVSRDAASPHPAPPVSVRAVSDDEWTVVAWLWQAFRHDLATVVHGLPYEDGRYQRAPLGAFPSPDGVGYLAWRPHPNTGRDAPVGFALVDGLTRDRRSIAAFWVAPAARREGVGRALATRALAGHEGPWSIAFQHDNDGAGAFWRDAADAAFGPGQWEEVRRPVTARPNAPADHVILSR